MNWFELAVGSDVLGAGRAIVLSHFFFWLDLLLFHIFLAAVLGLCYSAFGDE